MKKRTKKIAALLTTMALASTLFGCGNSPVSKTTEESKTSVVESTQSSSESSEVVNKEPVVLTVLTRSNVSPDGPLVYEEANKYIEEKLGFTVEFVDLGQNEFAEKSKMMFASGDKFDVAYTAESVGYFENVANGVYMPLDELLEEHGQDVLNAAPDYLFTAATVKGQIYAVPHLKDFVWPYIFQVKSYFVEKYNLDISGVDTLEEMTPILQTIKDNEPEFVPLLIKSNNNCSIVLPFEKIANSFVLAFDEKGEIVNMFDTDVMREFLPLMREWNQKGFFPADVETLTSLGDYTTPGTWASQIASYGPGRRLNTLEITDGFAGGPYSYGDNLLGEGILTTSGIMGGAWAISAETEHPEEAMQFINLIDTDAYLRNLMSFGIEGKHYVKVGDNQYKFPEGMTKAAETGYAPYSYMLGSTYNLFAKESQVPDYWEQYEEMNNSAKRSPALGFSIDLEPISTEIAAIGNVYNEYGPALECGAIEDWETALDTFLKKLDAVGLQDVIKELNRQYDEWKAANK